MNFDPPALSPLERAAGLPVGVHPVELGANERLKPRVALEEAVRSALLRPPCVVSFSGGRDSSAVLAVAVALARREGHRLPVPVTLRFPDIGSTNESSWQEMAIRHLGLTDWERIEVADDLELLGPLATEILRRHGPLWPPNAHFHVPILRLAQGGSLLTGADGDGALGSWRWARAQAVLHRRSSPRPVDLGVLALALAPKLLRRLSGRFPAPQGFSWLQAEAKRDFQDRWIKAAVSEPRQWNRRVSWYAGQRYLRFYIHSLEILSQEVGVVAVHPLADPSFLASLAMAGGSAGFASRTEAMTSLFSDLLPLELIGRRGKAEFSGVLWQQSTRAFSDQWTGEGIDVGLVDIHHLREEWRSIDPSLASGYVMQEAWLATASQERVDGAL